MIIYASSIAGLIIALGGAAAVIDRYSPFAWRSEVEHVDAKVIEVGGDFYRSQVFDLYRLQSQWERERDEALKRRDMGRVRDLDERLRVLQEEIQAAKGQRDRYLQQRR